MRRVSIADIRIFECLNWATSVHWPYRSPVVIARNHDDVALSWSRPRRCHIVVVFRGRSERPDAPAAEVAATQASCGGEHKCCGTPEA